VVRRHLAGHHLPLMALPLALVLATVPASAIFDP
jgi:hypothetical protein